MTILHLARSFGSKRLGGAERNIYNLVNLISLKTKEKNLIMSDNGIWEYHIKSDTFRKIDKTKIKLFFLLISNPHNQKINNVHVHSNGYYIFLGYIISFLFKCRYLSIMALNYNHTD